MDIKTIILGFDALDCKCVEKFNCRNLMQKEYGETNISDFEMEKTVVLWASFLTGKNMENVIKDDLWGFTLKPEETFFKGFESFAALDVPAFTLKQDNHKMERKFLAGFFKGKNSVDDYDEIVWKNHEENKAEFLRLLNEGKKEILMGYFDLADAIGHLSFGDDKKMKRVYKELDELAMLVAKRCKGAAILIVSDHGMKAIGAFGDHRKGGFYSLSEKAGLKSPKLTSFFSRISVQKL